MAPQEPEEGECMGAAKRRKAAAATDVSMELDILDCPVCYHPLRPPIFQVHARVFKKNAKSFFLPLKPKSKIENNHLFLKKLYGV